MSKNTITSTGVTSILAVIQIGHLLHTSHKHYC